MLTSSAVALQSYLAAKASLVLYSRRLAALKSVRLLLSALLAPPAEPRQGAPGPCLCQMSPKT